MTAICDYCDQDATRYDADTLVPLCAACAKNHYEDPGESTGNLTDAKIEKFTKACGVSYALR